MVFNNGLIIQYGKATGTNTFTITFPVAFSKIFGLAYCYHSASNAAEYYAGSVSTTNFTTAMNVSRSVTVRYIATGT